MTTGCSFLTTGSSFLTKNACFFDNWVLFFDKKCMFSRLRENIRIKARFHRLPLFRQNLETYRIRKVVPGFRDSGWFCQVLILEEFLGPLLDRTDWPGPRVDPETLKKRGPPRGSGIPAASNGYRAVAARTPNPGKQPGDERDEGDEGDARRGGSVQS